MKEDTEPVLRTTEYISYRKTVTFLLVSGKTISSWYLQTVQTYFMYLISIVHNYLSIVYYQDLRSYQLGSLSR